MFLNVVSLALGQVDNCPSVSKVTLLDMGEINRPISQMWAPLAACRKLAVDYDTFPKLLYVSGHKT